MKLNLTILAVAAMGVLQAETLTWTGNGANANMSTAENWSTAENLGKTPVTGDSLVFGGDAACLTPYNDLEGVKFNGITFKTNEVGEAAAYTFSGNGDNLS